MISRDTINRVFESLDIVEVAEKLVPDLKKAGASYKSKSPFTNEKSASFFVVPSKQIYKCFSTGKGGGPVSLVMEVNNMTYPEAIEWLADLYKITVEYDGARSEQEIKEDQDKEKRITGLMMSSHRKWKEAAANSPKFTEFVEMRGLTQDDIIQWGIALAPDEWRYLTPLIVDKGLMSVADEIGITKHSEDKNYDVYRNRIIFPIHSLKGKLIGFAGRILPKADGNDSDEAKYINPKESFLYQKSKVLYGWHFAANSIRKSGVCRLVEGYLDVIGLHRADVTNVVAPCGTSVTEEQARIIAKHAQVVDIIFDGDKAGIKAAKRAIDIFIPTGIEVRVTILGEGKDPDDLVRELAKTNGDDLKETVERELESCTQDAIEWLVGSEDMASLSAIEKGKRTKEFAKLISKVPNDIAREAFTDTVAKLCKVQKRTFAKMVADELEREEKRNQAEKLKAKEEKAGQFDILDENEFLPDWAMPMAKEIKRRWIVQRKDGDEYWPTGIYFPPVKNNAPVFMGLECVTNYTITPLFQIRHETNGRWLVEVFNGEETSTVELSDGALVAQDQFAKTMIAKRCVPTPKFQKFHYMVITKYIVDNTRKCFELNTLGFQTDKNFFAFSNAVIVPVGEGVEIKEYDALGIAEVNGENFLSSGASSVRSDYRQEDDMYENDKYLKYVPSSVTFSQWAEIYCKVYDDHGSFGVAFALLSIYKDFIYRIGAKCPLLYLYGPKGSGKSAMGESLMSLFFSGKNSDGRLIQAVNMSPGLITDFALASSLSRFANCPRLYNEYDPMLTEQKYRGWFKAAFDGEGRERGMGDSGGKRKTEIQKVKGTLILAGQYMDTADDGAVMTRSINLQFSEDKNKNRSEEQKGWWRDLNEMEQSGLSGVLAELIAIRPYVEKQVKERFYEIKRKMAREGAKKRGSTVEERLINNYSLCYTFCEIVNDKIKLPFRMVDFWEDCIDRMVKLSSTVSQGSILFRFWRVIEALVETGRLVHGEYYLIRFVDTVSLRTTNEGNFPRKFASKRNILYIRYSELYGAYSKEMKDRGQKAMLEDSIHSYLQDQPYFLGLSPKVDFSKKSTSAYALDLDMMNEQGIYINDTGVSAPSDQAVSKGEFSDLEDQEENRN